MNERVQAALVGKLLAMADDELILGHRNSEWTGHAPILEEDIAFANIAQDEIGHAGIWLGLRCGLTGEDRDRLVFFREPGQYRNLRLVELPKGDWAFTMLRQYFFDVFELVRLADLMASAYQPLAEAAAKIQPEEFYHFRHSHTWVKRLGLGTEESHRRMQLALDALWPHTEQLFHPMPDEELLVEVGYLPDLTGLRERWLTNISQVLEETGLRIPSEFEQADLSREQHSRHLEVLLADMQQVARADPEATW